MKSNFDMVIDRAMTLTADERIVLVQQIWDSLVVSGDTPPLDEETLALARERDLSHGTGSDISMEALMKSSYKDLSQTPRDPASPPVV